MAVEQVLHGHAAAWSGDGADDIEALRGQLLVKDHQRGAVPGEPAQGFPLLRTDCVHEDRIGIVRAQHLDPVGVTQNHRRDAQWS
ncbi:hypothetical protein AAHB34_06765 [Paenarthrobacter ureafaciens]